MKITKIKRMNEKELLHHIIDNTEICDIKYANDGGGNTDINLDLKNIGGNLKFNYVRGTGLSDALYDVEAEEEIDEHTVFEILLEIRKSKDIYTYSFESTNKIVGSSTKELHVYIDGEFKCIWRDGKLVE